MAGFLLHLGASGICPHGGQISEITSNMRVSVSNQKVVTLNDTFQVVGCVFNLNGSPHPCVNIKWDFPKSRVLVGGHPVLLSDSTGVCQAADQTSQGPPNMKITQLRVKGM